MSNTLSKYAELSRYFFPIALQAASQSVTYPLVSIIATNGRGATLELAGLAQSNSIMFLLGTLGAGLLTTGLVYAKTVEGYRQYVRLNYILAFASTLLQAVLTIPYFSDLLFGLIMGLPDSIKPYAARALVSTLPLHLLFFMRNPYQVCLYLNRATGRASLATIARIIFTLSITPVFIHFHLTGVEWASAGLCLGVLFELFLSWFFAKPYIRKLKYETGQVPSMQELFSFTIPLSIGGFFISISTVVVGMVISRAADAERLMPVFFLASGIAAPVTYAANRNQALTIAFPSGSPKDRTTFNFAVLSGIALGLIPLLFTLPGLSQWYYVKLQNCRPEDLKLIALTAFALVLNPLGIAIRSHCEGIAANLRKPVHILMGQGTYMGMLSLTSILLLFMKLPGNLIGPASFFFSNLVSAIIITATLSWEREKIKNLRVVDVEREL
ncbi:MAG: hypothetical protein GX556_15295 [Fibrobacter sp.]|nr:hypothetical protein [Fibrobacter sp.]